MSRRSLTFLLLVMLLGTLIMACTEQPTATAIPYPTQSMPTNVPTENVVEDADAVGVSKCPCGSHHTLEVWEDANGNKRRDDSERPLAGIALKAIWLLGPVTEHNASTGQTRELGAAEAVKRGINVQHYTATTDAHGQASLYMTGCYCDSPLEAGMEFQVIGHPGYRLTTKMYSANIWRLGLESDDPSPSVTAQPVSAPGLASATPGPLTSASPVPIDTPRPTVTSEASFDCTFVSSLPPAECEALVSLYHDTKGNDWKKKSNWLTADAPCDWAGVNCKDGHVIGLNLATNRLMGNIPPKLGNLTNLQRLVLDKNRLTGSIRWS